MTSSCLSDNYESRRREYVYEYYSQSFITQLNQVIIIIRIKLLLLLVKKKTKQKNYCRFQNEPVDKLSILTCC